jgi:hypothetical protein
MTLPSPARITAAVIAPLALVAVGCGADSEAPGAVVDTIPAAAEPSETPTEPAAIDFVVDDAWHQGDGDVVRLERAYDSAVLWNDQLVATYFDGEVFLVADVIDAEGAVVDSFRTTSPVAVNAAGTTIAWVDTNGAVMTAWDGDAVSLGKVDLTAAGEAVAWSVAAITGGPNCYEDVDGCQVFLNSGLGDESRSLSSHGINDIVAPGATKVFDATDDGVVSVIDKVTDDLDTCGGLLDRSAGTFRWETCDFQVQQISPDGTHVAATQSQYDGLGPTSLSVLDAETGEETGRFAPEGGFVAEWAWSTDGALVFSTYDGAQWHLMTMATDGELTEIADPVKGTDFESPFTLIRH